MEYLNKVLTYLKQELTEAYKSCISLKETKFIITMVDDVNFNTVFPEVHTQINKNIERVRNRKVDLNFSVRSKNQERDFMILK